MGPRSFESNELFDSVLVEQRLEDGGSTLCIETGRRKDSPETHSRQLRPTIRGQPLPSRPSFDCVLTLDR